MCFVLTRRMKFSSSLQPYSCHFRWGNKTSLTTRKPLFSGDSNKPRLTIPAGTSCLDFAYICILAENNKGADQPVHKMRRLIFIFVVTFDKSRVSTDLSH